MKMMIKILFIIDNITIFYVMSFLIKIKNLIKNFFFQLFLLFFKKIKFINNLKNKK